MKRIKLSFVFIILLTVSVSAKIKLPTVFSDNMVLQQQTDAPIWGNAVPGKNVEIITSWDKQKYTTTAASNGSWKMAVKTPTAGGPYTITISDGTKLVLNNVMIGEVWICSGQSNMEMPLAGWGKILDYEKEIAVANYPNIRLLQVEKQASTQPQSDLKVSGGSWQVCSPATIAEFSATAYFFGRNLHQNLGNVPIGLINTSWGGTPAEAWTSGSALENMPDFNPAIQEMKATAGANEIEVFQKKWNEWSQLILASDQGYKNNIPVWAGSSVNDQNWKEMNLPGEWEGQGMPDFDGIVWFRREVIIPDDWNGKELKLSFPAVDDNEITWFNGEKVGETEGFNVRRIYKIPGRLVKKGKAIIAVRVTDTGGGGGFHGNPEEMYIARRNKDKFSSLALTGNWKYYPAVDFSKAPAAPLSPHNSSRPSVLFNGMIHPIAPYSIKGAIWYQGEANEARPEQYKDLLPLLIRDWRSYWNYDFPFYFVQLPNFKNTYCDWALLRDAQRHALHVENTGMAVGIDLGNPDDIHPKNKQDIGKRLALMARAKTYGQSIAFTGPLYKSWQMEGNKIRVSFNYTDGGLKAVDNQPLRGFEIAGPDHKFYPAQVLIEGSDVLISAKEVPFPVAVRYNWANNPNGNLYNGAGFPTAPFKIN